MKRFKYKGFEVIINRDRSSFRLRSPDRIKVDFLKDRGIHVEYYSFVIDMLNFKSKSLYMCCEEAILKFKKL